MQTVPQDLTPPQPLPPRPPLYVVTPPTTVAAVSRLRRRLSEAITYNPAELRPLREQAHVKVARAAAVIGVSPGHLSRCEAGTRTLRPRLVLTLIGFYLTQA